ncbi:MAG TPA: methylated-DNA--[protein]-cysteine S-methyltransferase [Phycisphaerae bacterium]|nr:methylated-DNA--[protein]-cysteine S-methyltransferase [Phycisphaerae bacterium]
MQSKPSGVIIVMKDKRESAWGKRRVARLRGGEEIVYGVGRCWLGSLVVGVSEMGVVTVLMGREEAALVAELKRRFRGTTLVRARQEIRREMEAVMALVEGKKSEVDLELDIRGTPFQRRVWQEVRRIPAGETRTYSEIAERVGAGKAVRAVGSACTRNPLAMVIPCHRVIRKGATVEDGKLSCSKRQREMLLREKMWGGGGSGGGTGVV